MRSRQKKGPRRRPRGCRSPWWRRHPPRISRPMKPSFQVFPRVPPLVVGRPCRPLAWSAAPVADVFSAASSVRASEVRPVAVAVDRDCRRAPERREVAR